MHSGIAIANEFGSIPTMETNFEFRKPK